MIRIDKSDKQYAFVDFSDILNGISLAKNIGNNDMKNRLNEIFILSENYILIDNKNYIRLNIESPEFIFLKYELKVTYYDLHIDHNVLKDALVRAYFEFNHEMKNKLSIYFRKYVENEINGLDNTFLVENIKSDKELMDYIKKYNDFTSYIEKRTDVHKKLKDKIRM